MVGWGEIWICPLISSSRKFRPAVIFPFRTVSAINEPDKRSITRPSAKSFGTLPAGTSVPTWSAEQHFEEKTKGSIETGKLADFVILDKDPTAIDPEKIDTNKVAETMKEGTRRTLLRLPHRRNVREHGGVLRGTVRCPDWHDDRDDTSTRTEGDKKPRHPRLKRGIRVRNHGPGKFLFQHQGISD
jgi:hypothetical protein